MSEAHRIDPYEDHKLIYDIIDAAVQLRIETLQLSRVIDETYTLPNSMQGTLGMIYRYEGSTQSELSAIYQRESKNLIRTISELERRGLVYKKQEGRCRRLYLTDVGRQMNDQLMAQRGAWIDTLLKNLSVEDLEITRKTMKALCEATDQYLGKHIEKQF